MHTRVSVRGLCTFQDWSVLKVYAKGIQNEYIATIGVDIYENDNMFFFAIVGMTILIMRLFQTHCCMCLIMDMDPIVASDGFQDKCLI